MIIYTNNEITVRLLEQRDEQLLVKWLNNVEILRYYDGRDNPQDLELVRKSFYNQDSEVRCIVEYNSISIGYIQFYPVIDEDLAKFGYTDQALRVFGTDQFIGETSYWNRGIGKQLVASMTEYLIKNKQVNRIIMDPQAWNIRAITCYERCGFKKIKLLKEQEWHEGEWRDCWLMEYMNIQIRDASIDEIPIVFHTMQLAFGEYKDRLFPPSGALTETIENTEKIFAQGGGAVIAWDGDVAVGSARYKFYEDYIYIGRVSVVTSHRSRGISKSMLNKIEGISIIRGIGNARVEVRLSIPDNITFYEKLNYQAIEQIYYTEGRDSRYVMNKKLI